MHDANSDVMPLYFCHGSQSEDTETYAPSDYSTLVAACMSNNHRGKVITFAFAFHSNGEFFHLCSCFFIFSPSTVIDKKKDEKKGNVGQILPLSKV